jgi:hypothetical protein
MFDTRYGINFNPLHHSWEGMRKGASNNKQHTTNIKPLNQLSELNLQL